MQDPDPSTLLKQLITEKEFERALQKKALTEQFHIAYESVKPLNIIKNTFKQVISSPETKNGLANTAIGITAGFAAKKLFVGNSSNPITKLLGLLLEHVVTDKTIKNADSIKAVGSLLVKKLVEPAVANGSSDGTAA